MLKRTLYSTALLFFYLPFFAIQILFTNKNKTIWIGFYLNQSDRYFGALGKDVTFIKFNHLRKQRVVNNKFAILAIDLIKKIIKKRNYKIFVFNYRDVNNLNLDLSEKFGIVYRVETGLLSGSSKRKPLSKRYYHSSYMIDSKSIYFDSRKESDLENALNSLTKGYANSINGFELFKNSILNRNVTKYAFAKYSKENVNANDLVIFGQCVGDQALEKTAGLTRNNIALLSDVYEKMDLENYETIYYKPHPRNRSHNIDLSIIKESYPEIVIIGNDCNPVELLKHKPDVAVMTSGIGLEAAIRGSKVHCFNVSFYSNYGFTVDYVDCERRNNLISAEDLFAYVYCTYTKYIDVTNNTSIEFQNIRI